uniref:Interferon regulatory factor 3 n=1 Tax=Chrysemys picta bellii TaxID=8478 RepID=A0A8C3FNQ7_CHRPI
MGTPKPLIVPWLRGKLDSGCYPGVRWLDQGRTQFRVPWKHGLRQDASSEDFQLFRDWAIDSGSFRPGQDAPAPSVWKRNFRSALNRKPGIQVLRDHSSDSADPHKVYEILPDGARAGEGLDGGARGPGEQGLRPLLAPPCPPPPSLCPSLLTRSPLLAQPQAPPLTGVVSPFTLSLPAVTFFEVRVYYRGHLVLQTLVPNSQGFRLVPPSPAPSPWPELADVVLPQPGVLVDQVQASYTARLLQGLGAGVLLRVQGSSLCATRLGRLHAYWGRTETPEPGAEGGELSKEGYTPLYDLPRFVRGGAHGPADPAPAEPGQGGVIAAGGGAGPPHLGLAGGGRAAGGPAGLGGADGEPALRLAGRSRCPTRPNPGVRALSLPPALTTRPHPELGECPPCLYHQATLAGGLVS